MSTLFLTLGDQLSHSLLQHADKERDVIFLCEVWDEATYVRHHPKKIALLFSAMRHFAEELQAAGYTVDYVRLDDAANTGNFSGEVQRAVNTACCR
jgi:deoxyribodipyrimidine photolyase-related protein